MPNRYVIAVLTLCVLLFASGCGRPPEEPAPAAAASVERDPAAAQQGGAAAADAGGVSVAREADADASGAPPAGEAGGTPDTAAGDDGSPAPELADVLAGIQSRIEQTDFAGAERLCREAQGVFKDPASARELSVLRAGIRKMKKGSARLRYAVEQLGSADGTVVDIAAEKLLEAEDAGRLFLFHALRDKPSAIAGKAAAALALSNHAPAIPPMLDRVSRDKDPALGREVGAALRSLRQHLTADQLARCHAMVAADRTTARHGLLSVLAAVFAENCGRDAGRYNKKLAAADGYDALRNYTERLLASGDAELVAFAAPMAKRLGLTIPGSYVDNRPNRRFAEETALPLAAEIPNLVSGTEGVRTNAYAALRAAADLGRAVLYRAVRDGKPEETEAATLELVVRNDSRAYFAIVNRLAREPADSPLSTTLTKAALSLASRIDAHTCRTLGLEGDAR